MGSVSDIVPLVLGCRVEVGILRNDSIQIGMLSIDARIHDGNEYAFGIYESPPRAGLVNLDRAMVPLP